MLKLATVLTATAAALAPLASSVAADPAFPDLRGTWKLEANAIVSGAGGQHPANAPPLAEGMKPRLRPFEATMQVIGQEGDRFWGIESSPSQTEDFIGTFTGEGTRYIAVDSDGFFSGEVLGSGSVRSCYQHVEPTLHVAGCGTWTRQ